MANNDSKSLLDSLLFIAQNKWEIDQSQILENMNKISFHESKNVADVVQQSDIAESGIGPGRGLFQFEVGKGKGAHTAINRLISQLGRAPAFLEGMKESNYDVSTLSPEQQQILFLVNLLQKPSLEDDISVLPSFKGVDTDEELAHLWAQHHHAGTRPGTPEYDDMVDKFLLDLQEGYRKELIPK